LLDGEVEINGVRLDYPLGSPQRPARPEDLGAKLAMCGATELQGIGWEQARELTAA
jgi:hypothetical protein